MKVPDQDPEYTPDWVTEGEGPAGAPAGDPDVGEAKAVHANGRVVEDQTSAMDRVEAAGAPRIDAVLQRALDLGQARHPGVALGGVTEIEVSVGPETYSPVSYNSFTVGPVRVRMKVDPGETVAEAYRRAYLQVHLLFEVEFGVAVGEHLRRLKRSVGEAKADEAARRGKDR